MSPSSRLVAFFFGEGGEVVADSTLLEIDDGLPNKASHNYVKFRLRPLCCLGHKRRDRKTCWASIWLLSLLYMSLRGAVSLIFSGTRNSQKTNLFQRNC